MIQLLVLLVVGFVIYKIAAAIWRSRNATIIISSWGLVLAGQAEHGSAILDRVRQALEEARIGPFRWKQHADRFMSFVQRTTQTYAAVSWGELEAVTGAHPIGTDLYVSWNLVLPARGKQFRSEELGLNQTNELRAFASASLGITQEAVAEFALGGKMLDSEQLAPSGLLGPLHPRAATDEPFTPAVGPTSDADAPSWDEQAGPVTAAPFEPDPPPIEWQPRQGL